MLIPPGPIIFISTELPNPPGARHPTVTTLMPNLDYRK